MMHLVLAALLFLPTLSITIRAAPISLPSPSAGCYAAILEAREALMEEKGLGPISQNVVVAIILGIRELLPLLEAITIIDTIDSPISGVYHRSLPHRIFFLSPSPLLRQWAGSGRPSREAC